MKPNYMKAFHNSVKKSLMQIKIKKQDGGQINV